MRREDRPEPRVGRDGGVPDAIDRLDAVADPDRVDSPPSAGRPDAGVDLEVKVPVGITCPGRVVPDHRGLDLLDRHLHLPPTRSDPGGRVLSDPADDLGGRLVLGFVQRRRDLRMQRRGQGPGLGSVDRNLDEPECVRILAEAALVSARLDVDPGNPLLVGVPGHGPSTLDNVGSGGESLSDAGALGKVVVISPGAITLYIGPRGLRCAPVELHTAMHPDHPPQRGPSTTNGPLEMPRGPLDHGRPIYVLRSMRAAWKGGVERPDWRKG